MSTNYSDKEARAREEYEKVKTLVATDSDAPQTKRDRRILQMDRLVRKYPNLDRDRYRELLQREDRARQLFASLDRRTRF
ncbi:MAG TPA: hypothetical protein VEW42_01145 [Candidatus Eisenbacteria bacterium]|nr:hypothetical protein [Candidatus Eisenbacteria bacterium]